MERPPSQTAARPASVRRAERLRAAGSHRPSDKRRAAADGCPPSSLVGGRGGLAGGCPPAGAGLVATAARRHPPSVPLCPSGRRRTTPLGKTTMRKRPRPPKAARPPTARAGARAASPARWPTRPTARRPSPRSRAPSWVSLGPGQVLRPGVHRACCATWGDFLNLSVHSGCQRPWGERARDCVRAEGLRQSRGREDPSAERVPIKLQTGPLGFAVTSGLAALGLRFCQEQLLERSSHQPFIEGPSC